MKKVVPAVHKGRNSVCFSQNTMEKLSEIMYEHSIKANAHLFMEGEAANKIYYIKKGRMNLTKSAADGKEFILYVFQEGDFFGQFDPYHDSKQAFSSRALEDSVLGVIQKPDLEVILWQHGDLAIEFMKWMGLMHRMTQTKFQDLMLYGKTGALCSTLIRLTNTYGIPHPEGTLINEKLTNSDLADYIGAARESVNRMLGELKKEDVIAIENGHIIIKNIQYLRNICHCEMCPQEICRI